ncbi:MAG TPA: hypothetical protein VHP33_13075 [Polyangiaceae bacterium]|nr:hypothetical protein [Polyangiaceae bacterium]
MTASLKPCGSCSRHVRANERVCPFCGERVELFESVAELRLLSRLDRNTMVALGAVLSAAGIVLGCREAVAPVAVYGAPATPNQVQEPTAPPGSASPLEPLPPDQPPGDQPPAPSPAPVAPTASAAPGFPPAAAYGAPPSMGPGIAPAPVPAPPVPAPHK